MFSCLISFCALTPGRHLTRCKAGRHLGGAPLSNVNRCLEGQAVLLLFVLGLILVQLFRQIIAGVLVILKTERIL